MMHAKDVVTAIRTVVVDDEAYARQKIREFLRSEKDIHVVGEAGNGSDAIRVIREEGPDLVFLDVQMPKPDGFGVVEALGDGPLPHIVFATAYDQYALRAFEIHALDYLLKPFDRDRFRESLKHARRIIGMEKDREDFRTRVRGLIEGMRTESPYLQRFLIQSKRGTRFLRAEDVLYLEAAGSYVALHTETGEHLLRETLNDLEGKLDPRVFIRTHRSFIVNAGAIEEIQRHFHGESILILKNGRRVNVSRNYREHFRKAIEGRF
jgi:two-component system LytT family response regulator